MKHLLFLSLALFTCNAVNAEQSNALTGHQAMAREMLADVIAMDTSVIKRETPRMAKYLSERFIKAGFDQEHVTEMALEEDMVSLLVRYPGKNPSQPAIGFMAHMDVVPANPADWTLNPFELVEKDGYFIGRGTTDNKAGVVGLAATFMKLKQQGYVPERDLVLILTADEETTMNAANHIAKEMKATLNLEYAINADALSGILAPDGTLLGYYVQGAEKTYQTYRLNVKNPGGHSSAPRDDNAIYQLAEALLKIRSFKFPVILNEISRGMLKAASTTSDPYTKRNIETLLADPTNAEAAEALSRHPLLSTVIRTTCVATMLEAGHAENALPQSASGTVNCRIMPSVDPEEVFGTLTRVVDDQEVRISPMGFAGDNAPASPMRPDVMDAIGHALQEYPEVELIPFMASYGTDGKAFRAAGTPVYGSSGTFMIPQEAFAHGLNEKIGVKTFYASLDYWERLMRTLAANPVWP